MTTDQQYNEFFRSRLDDFPSPVPDDVWNSIEINNRKSRRKGLTWTKYTLLFFCLVTGIRTSDKLMHSGAQPDNISLYKINNTKTGANAVTNKSGTNDKEIAETPLKKQTNEEYPFYIKQKATGKLPATGTKKTNQLKTNMALQELNGNNTAAPVFNQTTDSITANTAAISKKQAVQNLPDSTDDITVETHLSKDRLSLYVFASTDAVFSHVSAGNRAYQQQRNREARSQLSGSSGIRVRYNVDAHWSGNIGFQYSVINEKIILPGKASNNRYTSFDVPVLAGYRVYKNRFEVDAVAGISFNISTAYKGYISSVSNEAVDIKKEKVYQRNTSLSYYAGAQFLYRPANRISLFAEPYFKYQPQNIANAFQAFRERIQKAGILLGARYRFNR